MPRVPPLQCTSMLYINNSHLSFEAVPLVFSKFSSDAGDLGDTSSDAPEGQQLSVWLEYNRVLRRRLVWEAATALSCCQPGGCVLLRIPDLLTTFTIGLLSVLHRCFRFFTLVKPFTSCTATAESFAIFVDCIPHPEEEDGELTPCIHLWNVRDCAFPYCWCTCEHS